MIGTRIKAIFLLITEESYNHILNFSIKYKLNVLTKGLYCLLHLVSSTNKFSGSLNNLFSTLHAPFVHSRRATTCDSGYGRR